MAEWKKIRVGDLGRVVTGRTPPNNDSAYFGGEVQFLTPTDIGDRRLIDITSRTISEFGIRMLSRCLVPRGVSVSCIGWQMGKTVLINRPTITNQQMNSIIVKDGIADCLFVYYALSSRRKEIFDLGAGGSRTPILNKSDFENLPFFLPEMKEQLSIASILGALDDKIELNRRTNETLEAMARALFKDWFVDFGPVRAKAEGRSPYLAPELWALFPDALDDDDKPVGWAYRPLDEIAEFLNGLALQKFPASEGEPYLPVIKIAELRNGVSDKCGRASRKLPEKYVVKDGDFLFSWSGSLLARFWTEGEGALNQHLFKVTSDKYPVWFFTSWVHHYMEDFQQIAASKATTMGHIQRGHLSGAMTICPPRKALEVMGGLMEPLVRKSIDNALEARSLAQMRDLLLPKLMSGEIRLKEAEKAVEAVA